MRRTHARNRVRSRSSDSMWNSTTGSTRGSADRNRTSPLENTRTDDDLLPDDLLTGGGANAARLSSVEEHSVDEHIATQLEVRSEPCWLEVGVVGGHATAVA